MLTLNQVKYFTIFVACFLVLSALHFFALRPETAFEQVIFILLVITLLPLSYTTLHMILSLLPLPSNGLKSDEHPVTTKVALIQPIYNDFSPEHTTKTMRNNPGFDYWMLSDSDRAEEIIREENYCRENGLKIQHRSTRRGKKAGAINDWVYNLQKYGYKYFVVLDKDSILGPGNVEDLIKVAEHSDNQRIGIFQTTIKSVQGGTIYSHLTSIINNSLISSTPKIDMIYLGGSLYWGHNALIRSQAFLEAGGEDEEYLSEDYAFTIKLEELGWNTRLVPEVVSYEEQPRDLVTAIERSTRWMKGSYSIAGLSLCKIRKISLGTMFQCLISPVFNVSTSALALVFFGVSLAPKSLFRAGFNQDLYGIAIGVMLFIYVTLMLNLSLILEASKKRDFKHLITVIPLNSMMSMVTLLRTLYHTLTYIVFRSKNWNPMKLNDDTLPIGESYKLMLPELLVGYFLMTVLWCSGNFLFSLYMLPWIIAFVCGPLLASYSSQKI